MEKIKPLFDAIQILHDLIKANKNYRIKREIREQIDIVTNIMDTCRSEFDHSLITHLAPDPSPPHDEPLFNDNLIILEDETDNSRRLSENPIHPTPAETNPFRDGNDGWHLSKATIKRNKKQLRKEETNTTPAQPQGRSSGKSRTSEAIIVQKPENSSLTYAQVFKTIRQQLSTKTLNTDIQTVRMSKKGSIIVRCPQNAKPLCEELTKLLPSDFKTHHIVPRTRVTICDLDVTTDEEEVKAALADYNIKVDKVQLRHLRGGRLLANLWITANEALTLSQVGKVRIGWTLCKIRLGEGPMKCYKCLKNGHKVSECKSSSDYRSTCFNCSQVGHKAAICQLPPHCSLCKAKGKVSDHAIRTSCSTCS